MTVQQIQTFKRENDLAPAEAADSGAGRAGSNGFDFDDEIDLRAQDDELIAAELEQAEAERVAREAEEAARREAEGDSGEEDEDEKPARRRGRRGGRGRTRTRKAGGPLEATFDHGEEGYGLWLDPAVADNPVYAEHWAGHRPVEVTIDEDQIVIRRVGDDADDDDEE